MHAVFVPFPAAFAIGNVHGDGLVSNREALVSLSEDGCTKSQRYLLWCGRRASW